MCQSPIDDAGHYNAQMAGSDALQCASSPMKAGNEGPSRCSAAKATGTIDLAQTADTQRPDDLVRAQSASRAECLETWAIIPDGETQTEFGQFGDSPPPSMQPELVPSHAAAMKQQTPLDLCVSADALQARSIHRKVCLSSSFRYNPDTFMAITI